MRTRFEKFLLALSIALTIINVALLIVHLQTQHIHDVHNMNTVTSSVAP